MMWGTTPPFANTTGDSGDRFEATLILIFAFVVFWPEISPSAFWDFCKKNRHLTDVGHDHAHFHRLTGRNLLDAKDDLIICGLCRHLY
jgi:hypothetical protein